MSFTYIVYRYNRVSLIGNKGNVGMTGPTGVQGFQPLPIAGLDGEMGSPGPTCLCYLGDKDFMDVDVTGATGDQSLLYNGQSGNWQNTSEFITLNKMDLSTIPKYSLFSQAQSNLEEGQVYLFTGDDTIRLFRNEINLYLRQGILSKSPILYYELNETNGTTAFDSSGNDYHGTYRNNTPARDYYTGVGVDQGWYYVLSGRTTVQSGSGYGIDLPTSPDLDIPTPCSVEIFFSAVYGTPTRYVFAFSNGVPLFQTLNTPMRLSGITTSASISLDQSQQQAVMVFKGGNLMDFYINGTKTDTDIDITGFGFSDVIPLSGAVLGNATTSFSQRAWYNGSISEFAIYDRILSSTEILDNYNLGLEPYIL